MMQTHRATPIPPGSVEKPQGRRPVDRRPVRPATASDDVCELASAGRTVAADSVPPGWSPGSWLNWCLYRERIAIPEAREQWTKRVEALMSRRGTAIISEAQSIEQAGAVPAPDTPDPRLIECVLAHSRRLSAAGRDAAMTR